MIFALVIAALLILAYLALYSVFTRPGAGRHLHPAGGRHARTEFADPADSDDPDGAGYVARLRATDSPAPAGPPRQAAPWDLAAPARLPMLPPDPEPPAASPVADTGEIPVAIAELGMPVDQYVQQVFARHTSDPEVAA